MRISRLIAVLFLMLVLSACNFTLAADVTPPPDYQPPAVAETQPALAGQLYPIVPPNPADGAAIFAEKCAPCHGETGMGDGQLATQLPFPAAPIGASELARQSTPSEWYRIVTQGNMERRMPPFNSLTERQRWDVVAYAFSLSASEQSISLGAELYQANCAGCHGEQGAGDGPQAASLSISTTDLTNQEWISSQSAADLFEAITSGVSPDMPAFGEQLSDTERWAITDYMRWLTFNGPRLAGAAQTAPVVDATPQAVSTPIEAGSPTQHAATPVAALPQEAGPAAGKISGSITNASIVKDPTDLAVTLHGFDDMQNVITDTTRLDADGSFAFENVPMPKGRVFLATIEYSGATYGSDIAIAQEGATDLVLSPINIYETTSDASGLIVDRLHLFFEFTDANTLQVIELYVVSNPGEKTLVAPGEGQPTVEFKLPQGASNLEFQDGELGRRYVKTPDGFGDTVAVQPGSGSYQVLFAFDMPFDRKLDLVQEMTLSTNAVVILAPEGMIKVKGDALQDEGIRPDESGLNYQMYSRAGLNAGEELSLTLTGSPTAIRSILGVGSTESLLVGLGALGLVLVVAGAWLYRRNQLREDEEIELEDTGPPVEAGSENVETVMDAILALDDLYKAGELPEEAYLQRRADLKARLKELIG